MAERKKVSVPSFANLLLAAALMWSFCAPLLVGDFGMHHRVGEWVLAHHAVPKTEFLTFTAAGHTWVTQEWLAGVLFAVLEKYGGLVACFAFGALLFTATLALLLRLGEEIGAEPLSLGGLLIVAWLAAGFYAGLTGSAFSHFLLAVELLLVDRLQRNPEDARPLLALPPLLALWMDLHGGVMVGVGLAGISVMQWIAVLPVVSRSRLGRLKLAVLAGAVTLVALLLQPHGVAGVVLPFRYLFGESDTGLSLQWQKFEEWAPLTFHSLLGALWVVLAGLAVASLALRPRSVWLRAPQMLTAGAFLLLSLKSQRYLPMGALLLFPVVCGALLVSLRESVGRHPASRFALYSAMEAAPRRRLAALLPWVFSLALCVVFGRWDGFDRLKESKLPMAAIKSLAALPGGNVFALLDWSGAVCWKAPQWKVFLQEDVSSYPKSVFVDSFAILDAEPGWRQKLDAYQVGAVLVPGSRPLARELNDDDAGWMVAYQDSSAMLFLRREPVR